MHCSRTCERVTWKAQSPSSILRMAAGCAAQPCKVNVFKVGCPAMLNFRLGKDRDRDTYRRQEKCTVHRQSKKPRRLKQANETIRHGSILCRIQLENLKLLGPPLVLMKKSEMFVPWWLDNISSLDCQTAAKSDSYILRPEPLLTAPQQLTDLSNPSSGCSALESLLNASASSVGWACRPRGPCNLG